MSCSRRGPLRYVCGQAIDPTAMICTFLESPTDLDVHPRKRMVLSCLSSPACSYSGLFEMSKNKSWDAHLDHLGFPKMYESQLCGDWCGRKPDAMNPSKGGTDRRTNRRRRTDRPKSSTLYPSASRGITYALMTQVRVAFLSMRSLLTLRCHSNICVGASRLPLPAEQLIKRGKSLLPRFIFCRFVP